jgi:hypothetical protein
MEPFCCAGILLVPTQEGQAACELRVRAERRRDAGATQTFTPPHSPRWVPLPEKLFGEWNETAPTNPAVGSAQNGLIDAAYSAVAAAAA